MEGHEGRFVGVGCWVYLVVLGWTPAFGILFGTKVRHLFGLVVMLVVLLWIAVVHMGWISATNVPSRPGCSGRLVGFQAVDIYPGCEVGGHASTRIVVLMV